MVLHFPNKLLSSLRKGINLLFLVSSPPLYLNVLTFLLILGNFKTSGLKTSSNYAIKYLDLLFALTIFEMITCSTLHPKYLLAFYAL